MPLPQLTLPDGFPCFLLEGHELQKASQYAHPKFQTGHSRARRIWTVGEKTVEVGLLLEADQAAEFYDWFEGPLTDAGGWFSAHVANDEDDLSDALWYRAEFQAPPREEPMHLGRWRIAATLRLIGGGQIEEPYTGELGGRARMVLTGSVRGTVEPTLGGTAELALLELFRLPGGTAVMALEQPVYFAGECECALEQP